MSKGSIDIRKVDNGFEITIHKPSEKPEIYVEPKRLVAKTTEEVKNIFSEFIGEKEESEKSTTLTKDISVDNQGMHMSDGTIK